MWKKRSAPGIFSEGIDRIDRRRPQKKRTASIGLPFRTRGSTCPKEQEIWAEAGPGEISGTGFFRFFHIPVFLLPEGWQGAVSSSDVCPTVFPKDKLLREGAAERSFRPRLSKDDTFRDVQPPGARLRAVAAEVDNPCATNTGKEKTGVRRETVSSVFTQTTCFGASKIAVRKEIFVLRISWMMISKNCIVN